MEDRVAEAERHAVERAREHQPRPRRRTGGDQAPSERHDQPDAPHPAQAVSCTASMTSTPSTGRYFGAIRRAITMLP